MVSLSQIEQPGLVAQRADKTLGFPAPAAAATTTARRWNSREPLRAKGPESQSYNNRRLLRVPETD
jgi:hypothetical protein